MGVVRPHIGLVGFLGRLVEIVVLLYQLLQLRGGWDTCVVQQLNTDKEDGGIGKLT